METPLLAQIQKSLDSGRLPARVFNDAALHELERHRLFGRAWLFLAHESELPRRGDFVVRAIADDGVIVVRDEADRVRVFLNSCRHRGTRICQTAGGNAKQFRCPYHGWVYGTNGELLAVSGEQGYSSAFDKKEWGLTPVPRVESLDGLVFASLDPAAPSLDAYLDGMKWYLELVTRRSAAGLEVVGAPQRWIAAANWKLGADNFVGDEYHPIITHRFAVELGMLPRDAVAMLHGRHVSAGNGHGLGLAELPPGAPLPPFGGYPEEIVRSLHESYPSPEHVEVARRTSFIHATVFPNLSFLNVMVAKDHRSFPTPFLTFRLWHPVGAGRTEIWSWFLVEKDAPDWFKEISHKAYVHTFGSSGTFEQDDVEHWQTITRAAGGVAASRQELNYQLGLGVSVPDRSWPGPGEAYPLDASEFNQRAFYRRWLDYLMEAA